MERKGEEENGWREVFLLCPRKKKEKSATMLRWRGLD